MADREHLPDNPKFVSSRQRWQTMGLWVPIWQATNARRNALVDEVDTDFLALPRWNNVDFTDILLDQYPGQVSEVRKVLGDYCDIPQPIIQVRYYSPALFQNEELHLSPFDEELRLDSEQIQVIGEWATELEPLIVTIG